VKNSKIFLVILFSSVFYSAVANKNVIENSTLNFADTSNEDNLNNKIVWGVQFSTFRTSVSLGIFFNPSINLSIKKHSFNLGLKTNLSETGLQGGYTYFINNKAHKLNLFFLLDLQYVGVTYDVRSRLFARRYFEQYFSYGINWEIFKGLYLNHNFGYGGYLDRGKYLDNGERGNFSYELGFLFKIGIGYNFNSKK